LNFLKHLSRAKALLHVVDILPADASDPVQNYLTIENELRKYDQDLADKPRILAVNKMDLLPESDRDKIVKEFVDGIGYENKSV
jgi:Predicted GTPase